MKKESKMSFTKQTR